MPVPEGWGALMRGWGWGWRHPAQHKRCSVPVAGWSSAHVLRARQGSTCSLHPSVNICQAAASLMQVPPGSVHLVSLPSPFWALRSST